LLTPGIKIGAGSFNADARGRWYINIPIEVECTDRAPNTRVGIDLGMKHLATLSTGDKIETPTFYRNNEAKLATLQRARKTPKRIRNIHAKIANRRKDFLHKASTKLAKQYGLIVVGDISPSDLVRTNKLRSINKALLDAGWSSFTTMRTYKSIRNGGSVREVSETYTTQRCSQCDALSGPETGIATLRIREWRCSECGTVHDRDVNSARVILRLGLADARWRSPKCLMKLGSPGLQAGGAVMFKAQFAELLVAERPAPPLLVMIHEKWSKQ
jgi:IS605 OrfB family transposase